MYLEIFCIILVLLQIIDLCTTYCATKNGVTTNVIIKYIINHMGILPTLFLTKAGGLIVTYWLFLLGFIPFIVILIFTYIYAILHNWRICRK